MNNIIIENTNLILIYKNDINMNNIIYIKINKI